MTMVSDHTQRLLLAIFHSFDAYKSDDITEEMLSECIEINMVSIENPDFYKLEGKLIRLIAFIEKASYILPYSKKRKTIVEELDKVQNEITEAGI